METSPIKKQKMPKIAIIGRPNVGKSTLFNRLIRNRRSITDPTPGVTRDSVEYIWKIGDKPFLLIDTGGYNKEEEVFNDLVADKALQSATEADLVLFMVDVGGLNSNDHSFIEEVRPFSEKLYLVVNKVDHEKKDTDVWDLYQLGFQEVIPISAAHGRNIDDLEELVLERFKDFPFGELEEESEEETPIKIAILGKPNTGKSTLANYLIGEEKSIVSDIPGTTRDIVEGRFHFHNQLFQILDTAGIRRKKKVVENVEYYSVNRAISSIETCDIIFLLIESLEGITDQDKKLADLVVDRGKGVILVLSKWDTLEDMPNQLEAMRDRTRFLFPILSFAPILPISSLDGTGIKKLIKSCFPIYQQLHKRVETSKLNAALKKWVEYYPLRNKGKAIRILYMTQVCADPVKFVLFVSRKKGYRDEYSSYLKNKIKEEFGFDKIPFTLDVRERS